MRARKHDAEQAPTHATGRHRQTTLLQLLEAETTDGESVQGRVTALVDTGATGELIEAAQQIESKYADPTTRARRQALLQKLNMRIRRACHALDRPVVKAKHAGESWALVPVAAPVKKRGKGEKTILAAAKLVRDHITDAKVAEILYGDMTKAEVLDAAHTVAKNIEMPDVAAIVFDALQRTAAAQAPSMPAVPVRKRGRPPGRRATVPDIRQAA